MKKIGLYDAKTKLSALVQEVIDTGKPIALTKHGHVVAELSPPPKRAAPKAGMLKSQGFSIAADFDDCDLGFEDLDIGKASLHRVADEEGRYRNSPKS